MPLVTQKFGPDLVKALERADKDQSDKSSERDKKLAEILGTPEERIAGGQSPFPGVSPGQQTLGPPGTQVKPGLFTQLGLGIPHPQMGDISKDGEPDEDVMAKVEQELFAAFQSASEMNTTVDLSKMSGFGGWRARLSAARNPFMVPRMEQQLKMQKLQSMVSIANQLRNISTERRLAEPDNPFLDTFKRDAGAAAADIFVLNDQRAKGNISDEAYTAGIENIVNVPRNRPRASQGARGRREDLNVIFGGVEDPGLAVQLANDIDFDLTDADASMIQTIIAANREKGKETKTESEHIATWFERARSIMKDTARKQNAVDPKTGEQLFGGGFFGDQPLTDTFSTISWQEAQMRSARLSTADELKAIARLLPKREGEEFDIPKSTLDRLEKAKAAALESFEAGPGGE